MYVNPLGFFICLGLYIGLRGVSVSFLAGMTSLGTHRTSSSLYFNYFRSRHYLPWFHSQGIWVLLKCFSCKPIKGDQSGLSYSGFGLIQFLCNIWKTLRNKLFLYLPSLIEYDHNLRDVARFSSTYPRRLSSWSYMCRRGLLSLPYWCNMERIRI